MYQEKLPGAYCVFSRPLKYLAMQRIGNKRILTLKFSSRVGFFPNVNPDTIENGIKGKISIWLYRFRVNKVLFLNTMRISTSLTIISIRKITKGKKM